MMEQTLFSTLPAPPCAKLLGWELIAEYPDEGRIEIAFHPTADMLNPRGAVQGGFVAAMLDDTMGPAIVSSTNCEEGMVTIDMNVTYLRPVYPGRVIGKGRIINRGRTIVYMEAELFDEAGEMLARATSSGRVMTISDVAA
jgi:uncharacterized protein (TIGR00369 family)